MKAKLIDKTGKSKKELDLPKNFSQEMRKDIVLKVFEAQKRHQPYGTKPGAGSGYSASGISIKKRHAWKTTYGKGISRIPRKIMSRSGSSFNWVGATTTNTRGGRQSHPPRTEKNQFKKINKKELLEALNSCFSATANKTHMEKIYGKEIPSFPLVFDQEILSMKTKDFISLLESVFGKLSEKLLKRKSKRAGRGKTRGRKYKSSAGMIFVLGKDEEMKRKGVDVVKVDDLKIKNLTLNGEPKRIVAYTEKAIKEIGEKWKK